VPKNSSDVEALKLAGVKYDSVVSKVIIDRIYSKDKTASRIPTAKFDSEDSKKKIFELSLVPVNEKMKSVRGQFTKDVRTVTDCVIQFRGVEAFSGEDLEAYFGGNSIVTAGTTQDVHQYVVALADVLIGSYIGRTASAPFLLYTLPVAQVMSIWSLKGKQGVKRGGSLLGKGTTPEQFASQFLVLCHNQAGQTLRQLMKEKPLEAIVHYSMVHHIMTKVVEAKGLDKFKHVLKLHCQELDIIPESITEEDGSDKAFYEWCIPQFSQTPKYL